MPSTHTDMSSVEQPLELLKSRKDFPFASSPDLHIYIHTRHAIAEKQNTSVDGGDQNGGGSRHFFFLQEVKIDHQMQKVRVAEAVRCEFYSKCSC